MKDCTEWLEYWFERNCDYDPTGKQKMYYPACVTLSLIHREYVRSATNRKVKHYEFSKFCKVVHERFPHVAQAKDESMFHCDTCLRLREELRSLTNTKDAKQAVIAKQQEISRHRAVVALERRLYKEHQLLGRTMPEDVMCLIIDGMDQTTCCLPQWGKARGDQLDKQMLLGPKAHLTGVRDHNAQVYCYWAFDHVPKDGALVVNCLLLTLNTFRKKRGFLPRMLFIQLDNTKKENKNYLVMGLLSHLLKTVFGTKIQVNFLPVGHTHEDIDQVFSAVALTSRTVRPRSLPHLLAAVDNIRTTGADGEQLRPVQVVLENYLDLRYFMNGQLPSGKDKLEGLDGAKEIRISYSPQLPAKPTEISLPPPVGATLQYPIIQTKSSGIFKNSSDPRLCHQPLAGAPILASDARLYNPRASKQEKLDAIKPALRMGPLRPLYCTTSSSGGVVTEGHLLDSAKCRATLDAFKRWHEVSTAHCASE